MIPLRPENKFERKLNISPHQITSAKVEKIYL